LQLNQCSTAALAGVIRLDELMIDRAFVAARGFGFIVLTMAAACGSPVCAEGPSLDEFAHTLREAGGPDAQDCGLISLSESRASAVSCATKAIAEGRPFSVGFQVQGIDSRIYLGLARAASGKTERFYWDSDVFGGSKLFAKGTYPGDPAQNQCCRPHRMSHLSLVPMTVGGAVEQGVEAAKTPSRRHMVGQVAPRAHSRTGRFAA
jgi:hypothetical protein